MTLKFVLILANSAGPDEMPPYAAFHLELHCLLKYLFTSIRKEKGCFISKIETAISWGEDLCPEKKWAGNSSKIRNCSMKDQL